MSVKIGLPRALLYYQYGPIWERFLQELGAEVIVSGETSKTILNYGSALDEVCLPVKVFFGHVCELYKKVDYLFIPRMISVVEGQYTCPQIIGMPDVLRSNIESLPPIIDVDVNLRENKRNLLKAIISVGRTLGKNSVSSFYAWYRAWNYCRRHKVVNISQHHKQRVGLIGHPYIINDKQISMHILERLNSYGVEFITPDMISRRQAAKAAKALTKEIFWSNGQHLAGVALALLQSSKPVDGLIFITSFSCGPDALVGELISQHAKDLGIPCMCLTVDEHTAEAGFVTRIEAFTDMLIRRNRQ